MRYMLLIHANEQVYEKLSPAENERIIGEYRQFTTDLQKAGAFISSDRLRPVSSATTVRIRDSKTLMTDGPFAETKEQLGGFYMIDVKNLDEALAWAARVPCVKRGSIEVRPIWEYSE